MSREPLWIDDLAKLEAAARRWSDEPALAVDTEFVFERTYRPRPGIVQVATGDEVALVDAVALPDLAPLCDVMTSLLPVKVLHSASGDAAVLERLLGAAPRPVFDTQVAAAYCGLGASLAYAAVVEEVVGVTLAKGATRTDWTRRPLSDAQIHYAAEDVEHLLPVADALRTRLTELGRLAWAEEDSARTVDAGTESSPPEEAHRRVKGLGRLRGRERATAVRLAEWREREAARLDLARPFLLRDETLLALAKRSGLDPADARRLPGFDPRRHARHVERWSAALEEARRGPVPAEADDPPRRPSRAERDARERQGQEIANAVARVAETLDLPAELLLSRRHRERLLAGWNGEAPLSARLDGFRRELLGPPIDALGLRPFDGSEP